MGDSKKELLKELHALLDHLASRMSVEDYEHLFDYLRCIQKDTLIGKNTQ
jgi:hypothetical protein